MLHRLSSSSHCSALSSSCPASWLSHCLSPSSCCATLLSTRRTSLLSHRLSSSSRCAPRCPLVLSSHRLVVVSPLNVPPSRRLIVLSCCLSLFCRTSWLWYCLSLSSHCTALSSSCPTSWLPHCLSPSSHCATLLTTRCTSLLLHRLSSSSRCATRCPLTLSLCRVVVESPLDVPPSCHLVVSLCCLSLSRCTSWLLRHHLSSSSHCTTLLSSHYADELLHCLSLRRLLFLLS